MLRAARRDARMLARIRREKAVVILNLHQVSPAASPFWPPLKPKVFDDLLKFLKENFTVALFGELSEIKSSAKPVAVLSFDDGYYNFVEYAAPLLQKHGLQANMNVIPQCVETGRPIWNVRLYDFLNAAPRSLLNEIRLPGFDFRLNGDGAEEKMRFGLNISKFLKNRPRLERENLFASLEETMRRHEFPLTRMMNRDEVLRAADEGHEIGAHSFSHESMEFEPDEFFRADFRRCKDYFAEKLNLPLDIYAFPNGSCRPEQIEILQNGGVKHILLVGEDYARADRRVYPRLTIYGSSATEIRFRALGINRKQ
jgi:peptidoglycan/xylan/chitin deacetylase (PgdA/CDA1 family)